MDTRFLLGQLFGAITFITTVYAYQCKTPKKMFGYFLLGNVAYTISLYLLNALTGSYTMIVILIRSVVLYESEHKWAQWKGWAAMLILANIGLGIYSWVDIFSIFPVIASIEMIASSWTRQPKYVRIFQLLIGSPFWIIYDLHVASYAGIITEIISIASIVVAIKRFGWNGDK